MEAGRIQTYNHTYTLWKVSQYVTHCTVDERHQHPAIHHCLHLHKREIFYYKILAPNYQTKGHHITEDHNLDIHYQKILSSTFLLKLTLMLIMHWRNHRLYQTLFKHLILNHVEIHNHLGFIPCVWPLSTQTFRPSHKHCSHPCSKTSSSEIQLPRSTNQATRVGSNHREYPT